MVDFQHVFHRAHKVHQPSGGMHQHSLGEGLTSFFSCALRTVSGWMLSTISHSTSRSASVQRARPSGGSPQASAIRWASAAPSSFFGRRRCCSLRPKAASIPSSTQRRRTLSTVALAVWQGPGNLFVGSVFLRFIAQQQDMGLLVRCCPSLGNQGQFLPFFRGV